MSLTIRVITPDRVVWNTTTDEAIIPSATGQLGILKNHASLVTTLDIGVLRIRTNDKWTPLIVLGGFAEVLSDNITVLVNGVEEITSGDIVKTKAELEEASTSLENATTDREKIAISEEVKRLSARIIALSYL